MLRRLIVATVAFVFAFAVAPRSVSADPPLLHIVAKAGGYVKFFPTEWCRKVNDASVSCRGSNRDGNTIGITFYTNIQQIPCYVDYDYLNGVPHLRGTREKCTAVLDGHTIVVWRK
jgi:hypothetical protein